MSTEKVKQLSVSKIMKGKRKIILNHANKEYMLSITRRGKLILTAADSVRDEPTPIRLYQAETT